MDFNNEQLRDLRSAVKYFMQRQIPIKSPRYNEYEVILQMLSKSNNIFQKQDF